MKHSSLKITLLAASLLLAGCNSALSTISSTSSALASSASESLSSTSEVSSSSEASSTTSSSDETSTSTLISSSSSSQDVRSNYGDFSLVQTTNGTAPTYDEASNTWTIGVSAKKATYTVSGYFKGKIVVANPSGLTDYKGVVIKLNQAYIESDDDKTCAITYSNDAKYLALETVSGTVNYISGAAGAVESSNNLRLGGVGNLYLLSAMGHEIYAHYIGLTLAVVGIGILIGEVVGPILVPFLLGQKYDILYTLPARTFVFPWLYGLLTALFFLGVSALVSFLVCHKEVSLKPAESMIAGFDIPTSGKILLNGQDITNLPPYERPVNTVFQHYALFPNLDVYDNIAFGLKLKKVPKEVADRHEGF